MVQQHAKSLFTMTLSYNYWQHCCQRQKSGWCSASKANTSNRLIGKKERRVFTQRNVELAQACIYL